MDRARGRSPDLGRAGNDLVSSENPRTTFVHNSFTEDDTKSKNILAWAGRVKQLINTFDTGNEPAMGQLTRATGYSDLLAACEVDSGDAKTKANENKTELRKLANFEMSYSPPKPTGPVVKQLIAHKDADHLPVANNEGRSAYESMFSLMPRTEGRPRQTDGQNVRRVSSSHGRANTDLARPDASRKPPPARRTSQTEVKLPAIRDISRSPDARLRPRKGSVEEKNPATEQTVRMVPSRDYGSEGGQHQPRRKPAARNAAATMRGSIAQNKTKKESEEQREEKRSQTTERTGPNVLSSGQYQSRTSHARDAMVPPKPTFDEIETKGDAEEHREDSSRRSPRRAVTTRRSSEEDEDEETRTTTRYRDNRADNQAVGDQPRRSLAARKPVPKPRASFDQNETKEDADEARPFSRRPASRRAVATRRSSEEEGEEEEENQRITPKHRDNQAVGQHIADLNEEDGDDHGEVELDQEERPTDDDCFSPSQAADVPHANNEDYDENFDDYNCESRMSLSTNAEEEYIDESVQPVSQRLSDVDMRRRTEGLPPSSQHRASRSAQQVDNTDTDPQNNRRVRDKDNGSRLKRQGAPRLVDAEEKMGVDMRRRPQSLPPERSSRARPPSRRVPATDAVNMELQSQTQRFRNKDLDIHKPTASRPADDEDNDSVEFSSSVDPEMMEETKYLQPLRHKRSHYTPAQQISDSSSIADSRRQQDLMNRNEQLSSLRGRRRLASESDSRKPKPKVRDGAVSKSSGQAEVPPQTTSPPPRPILRKPLPSRSASESKTEKEFLFESRESSLPPALGRQSGGVPLRRTAATTAASAAAGNDVDVDDDFHVDLVMRRNNGRSLLKRAAVTDLTDHGERQPAATKSGWRAVTPRRIWQFVHQLLFGMLPVRQILQSLFRRPRVVDAGRKMHALWLQVLDDWCLFSAVLFAVACCILVGLLC